MNPLHSAMSRYFRFPQRGRGRTGAGSRKEWRQRLCLEVLEDRMVPASISIAGATINEIGSPSAFITAGSGGLSSPFGITMGPDGNVYVAANGGAVLRYNGTTGQYISTFVAQGLGGLSFGNNDGLAFGPDSNLYVASGGTNQVLEYNGSTGAFLKALVAAGSGGLNIPQGLTFGPDGSIYVCSNGSNAILRYQGPLAASPGSPLPAAGQSGATFIGSFVSASQGGGGPTSLIFGPDGNLYVDGGQNLGILRYNGTTGVFIDTFVPNQDPAHGNLAGGRGMVFDQEGRLYVGDSGNTVHRYDAQGNSLGDLLVASVSASLSKPLAMTFDAQGDLLISCRDSNTVVRYDRGVEVTLSPANSTPVSVSYATADGSALAGTNYFAQSGTVTFNPGQTSRRILLASQEDLQAPGNVSFSVQLSNPTGGATIGTGTAAVAISVDNTTRQFSIGDSSAIEGDSTAHYRGAFVQGISDTGFLNLTFGPDGNLYTTTGPGVGVNAIAAYSGTTGASRGQFVAPGRIGLVRGILFNGGYLYLGSQLTNEVLRYDATTGAFVDAFVSGVSGSVQDLAFGPDANGVANADLYVSTSNGVSRYDGVTGALQGTYITNGSGGLTNAGAMTFDPSQSDLFITSGSNQVLEYNARTGAFLGVAASAGVSGPVDVKFGPDGLLYVLSAGNNRILRFTSTGTYVDDYVPAGSGSMSNPYRMAFGPNGDLYVSAGGNSTSLVEDPADSQIFRFGTESEALFTVTNTTPSTLPLAVNYATADGTAVAGRDYTTTSGTLTFAPGVTSETIRVPILNDAEVAPTEMFTVNLSNPTGATIAKGQAVGTIIEKDAKAPVITSVTSATFTAGAPSSFSVTATGAPTPTLTESGVLPGGVSFDSPTGILGGAPALGAGGTYALTFTASNGVGTDATQNFTLTVNQNSTITSLNNATFAVGTAGSFTVTVSGSPRPTLTRSGVLPSGVSFNPGTGLLSGTPAAGNGGTYALAFTASNGIGAPATQSFILTINQSPAITSVNNSTFTVGAARSFAVTTTGFPTSTLGESGALPSGVSFNGATGLLSGTPASGTGGAYPLTFTASNGVGTNFTQNFTLTVNQYPAFTSANKSTFVVGNLGSFSVTATGFPSTVVSESGALPGGVNFDAVTGILRGTPAAGSSGAYPLTFTASDGVGNNAVQGFILTVGQAPAITSANGAAFNVGSAGSFTVTTTGFPSALLEEIGALPSGVSFNGATGVLSGTPALGAVGTYALTFTASNGIGADFTQNFTVTVNEAPAITSLDKTNFNLGTAGSFTLAVSGFPTPLVTESGALPGGVSFNSATDVLSGTPAAGTGGVYALTFTGDNGIGGPAIQHFVLTINEPLAISSSSQTNFSVDRSNSFAVSATGFPKPVLVELGTLPSGVTFDPATGILSGSPPIGTDGSYLLTFTAENGVGAEVSQNFKLTVQETANQQYISAVYDDLLGHAPDPQGLAYWSGLLDIGVSRAAVLNLFDHGIWYFSPIIISDYQQYFGRTPDSGGLVFWTQQMINGVTDEQLEASLIASAEYYQHASGTDKGWVNAMYQDLLGRQADSQGEKFWTQQLASGTSRSSVALGFAASTERESHHILADYQKYLGRPAGSSEIDYWLGRFGQGVTNEDIITSLLVSDEYYNKRT